MAQYTFKISGKEYKVSINSIEGKTAQVNVNGADYLVELENAPAAAPAAPAAPVQAAPAPAPAAAAPAPAPAAPKGAQVQVTSPMEGKVLEICAKPGDAVKAGQKVVVIESMKMEVEISAPQDGTIGEILVHKGDQLSDGQAVATLA